MTGTSSSPPIIESLPIADTSLLCLLRSPKRDCFSYGRPLEIIRADSSGAQALASSCLKVILLSSLAV